MDTLKMTVALVVLLSAALASAEVPEHRLERRSLASLLASSPSALIPALVLLAPSETIVSIIVELNETVQAHVMGALSAEQILQVIHKLRPEQRSELISHIAVSVIRGVILPKMSQSELGRLLEALTAETLVTLTKKLTPQEVLDIIKKLTAHDLITVLKILSDEQVTEVLSPLPRDGVVALAASVHDDRLSRLVGALPAAA